MTELTRDEILNDLDEEMNLDKLVVGIPEEYLCQDMSDETVQAWNDAAECLAAHCGSVEVRSSNSRIQSYRGSSKTEKRKRPKNNLCAFNSNSLDSFREYAAHEVRSLLLLGPQPL